MGNHQALTGVWSSDILAHRPSRYQCQDCEGHPTTTQVLGWSDGNSLHSFAYDNHILLQLLNSTVEDVRVKEELSYDRVAGVLERRIETNVDWATMVEIEILGLDEISLRKGQGNYVTLVTGRFRDGDIEILGVLPGREKAVVVEYLRLIPRRILQTIQAVCCDLWEAYVEAVREEIPSAGIVADSFHVARHYRDAADEIRKTELQRLKKELSKEEYKKLNGSFRAFRKNAKDLNKEERKVLRSFFEYSPCARQVYDFREQFTAIYDMNLSRKQAKSKFLRWILQVEKAACFVSTTSSVCFVTGGKRSLTFLFAEKIAASWKVSITRSKSLSDAAMVFAISHTYSSVSILTCLAIAYLLPPPYMPESRQFPESPNPLQPIFNLQC
jgi:transposase